MNRNDLVRIVSERCDLKPGLARQVIETVFGTDPGAGAIVEALERGDRVSIAGFGTFGVRQRAARTVKDPRSGVVREVAAGRGVAFRPGVGMRDRVR